MDDQKGFIEEIRSLDDPVKRKIMLITTATLMILIIYFWLAYFNTIVPNAVPVAPPQAPTASAQDVGGPGIFGLFANAASSFWQSVLNGVRGAAGALKDSKQYNISPK